MHDGERTWAFFWSALREEKETTILLTSSAFLLVLAWYPGYYTSFLGWMEPALRQSTRGLWLAQLVQFLVALLLLVLVPMVLIKWRWRGSLRDYGVCLGDWRFGLKYLAVVCVLMAPALYFTGADPLFYQEYPLVRRGFGAGGWQSMLLWELTYLLYYIAWEFHFRGYQQFGLARRWGPVAAILFQMMASTLIHMRKPFGETLSAIAGAFLIGYLAWRSRSVLWGIFLHWYIGASTDFWCYFHWKQAGFPS